jgi:hypothetical protein
VVEELEASAGGRVDGYVVDLRGNMGGLLTAAIHLSDLLLPPGSLITSLQAADGPTASLLFPTASLLSPIASLLSPLSNRLFVSLLSPLSNRCSERLSLSRSWTLLDSRQDQLHTPANSLNYMRLLFLVLVTGVEVKHIARRRATLLPLSRPLAVVIDGMTASSSELIAAALGDHERALLVSSTSAYSSQHMPLSLSLSFSL